MLTQNHWDTEEALKKIDLDAPHEPALVVLEKTDSLCRERVVQFDDFKVDRVTLTKNAHVLSPKGNYQLLLVVSGDVAIETLSLGVERACLIPANTESSISCLSATAVILLAEPV